MKHCVPNNSNVKSRLFLPILAIFILLYMCIGAAVFSVLEAPQEANDIEKFRDEMEGLSLRHDLSYDELIAIISDYEDTNELHFSTEDLKGKGKAKWDFFGAFVFSGTVVTTIGFGASSPASEGARIFYVFYGLFGIPAVFLFFNTWLIRFIEYFAYVVTSIKRRMLKGMGMKEKIVYTPSPTHVLMALLTVNFALIFSASGIYDVTEKDWNYANSFYYCFSAFSTIGFGDYVSGQDEEYATIHVYLYHFIDAIFITLGCCSIYALFNVISLFIKRVIDGLILRCTRIRRRTAPEKDLQEESVSYQNEEDEESNFDDTIYDSSDCDITEDEGDVMHTIAGTKDTEQHIVEDEVNGGSITHISRQNDDDVTIDIGATENIGAGEGFKKRTQSKAERLQSAKRISKSKSKHSIKPSTKISYSLRSPKRPRDGSSKQGSSTGYIYSKSLRSKSSKSTRKTVKRHNDKLRLSVSANKSRMRRLTSNLSHNVHRHRLRRTISAPDRFDDSDVIPRREPAFKTVRRKESAPWVEQSEVFPLSIMQTKMT